MRRRLLVACGVVMAMSLAAMTTAGSAVVQYVRISGTDRFDTANTLADQLLPPPAGTVYVTTGDAFPDALSASAAAAHFGGPVLLVHKTSLPIGTRNELSARAADKVVVVGGTGAISDATVAAIAEAARVNKPNAVVVRRGASVGSRYDTAAFLSQDTFPANVPVVYIASGATFPDALAGSAAAGTQGAPILLVPPSGPFTQSFADELQRLNPPKVVILGGYSAIPLLQEANMKAMLQGAEFVRVAGADRYATAVALSKSVFSPGVPYLLLVTGENYPDGLAAGAIAGGKHVPVLLTNKGCMSKAVSDEIERLGVGQVFVVGGVNAITQTQPPVC